MNMINPVQLFLKDGDGYRSAITLLDFINNSIPEAFDKKTMRAEVTVDYLVDAPTQLFIIKKMQLDWHVSFEKDGGKTFITAVAMITPEEKKMYLASCTE